MVWLTRIGWDRDEKNLVYAKKDGVLAGWKEKEYTLGRWDEIGWDGKEMGDEWQTTNLDF
jgi:hypothetical protein